MATFSERLKELRKAKNMTQENFAKHFFITKSAVSKYENGVNTPESKLLQKIADYFEVSTDYLLGRSDERNYTLNSSKLNEPKKLSPKIETIAAHLDDLDDEQIDEVNNFIGYLKSRKK